MSKPAAGIDKKQSKAQVGQICIKFKVTTHRNSSELKISLLPPPWKYKTIEVNFHGWLKRQLKTQT